MQFYIYSLKQWNSKPWQDKCADYLKESSCFRSFRFFLWLGYEKPKKEIVFPTLFVPPPPTTLPFPLLLNKVSQTHVDHVGRKRSLSLPDDRCSSRDNEGSSKSTASSFLLTGSPAYDELHKPPSVPAQAAAGHLGRKTISKPSIYALKYQVVVRIWNNAHITVDFSKLYRELRYSQKNLYKIENKIMFSLKQLGT